MNGWQQFQQAGWQVSLWSTPLVLMALLLAAARLPGGLRPAVLMGGALLFYACAGALQTSWAYLLVGALNLTMYAGAGVVEAGATQRQLAAAWAGTVFAAAMVPAAWYGAEAMVGVIVCLAFLLAPLVVALYREDALPVDPELTLTPEQQQRREEEARLRAQELEALRVDRPAAAARKQQLWDSVPALPGESYRQRRVRVLAARRRQLQLAARAGQPTPTLYPAAGKPAL